MNHNYLSTSNLNFCQSPGLSGVHKISTRYSGINQLCSAFNSQFLDEEQVNTFISTTNLQTQPQHHSKHSRTKSSIVPTTNDLVASLQKATQSICQMTADLKSLSHSIQNRNLEQHNNARKSQYSYVNDVSSSVSNNTSYNPGDLALSSTQKINRSEVFSNGLYSSEFPPSSSQHFNAPLSQSNVNYQYLQNKSQVKETNPLNVSSYYDGNQTVISMPFLTYTNENEDIIDTRANYRSSNKSKSQQNEETEESTSRRYYVKHEDLEYEEFEDTADPSKNYKQIKYPYTYTWKRVEQAPEFIQGIIFEQKKRSNELQSTPIQSQVQFQLENNQDESYIQQPCQIDTQYQLSAKNPNYLPKSSINFLDETGYRSQADTSFMTSSYMTSINNLPYQI